MKRNSLKNAVALAICACALTGAAANAQVVIGSSDLERYNGSLVVDRFGINDGRLVAYGRLVPSSSSVSSFDHDALGSWTGIGSGYGESGVESRSNMTSDYDGPTSMSLVRPSDDGIDISMGATSGNDRIATGLDVRFGPTSGNDRTSLELSAGSTSANDRTSIDASMGATSGNDRTGIDLKFGPTSANDRVADPSAVDLHFGPASGNDRTSLDGDMGATSANDRTSIDARFGPTSGNDRVGASVDLQAGPTSGNDRVASGIDVSMGATSGNDVQGLGVSSSSTVMVPVTVVSASCDAVSLSFGGSSPVTIRSTESNRSSFCAVSSSSSSVSVSEQLNVIID